jgi:hypothetical protein
LFITSDTSAILPQTALPDQLMFAVLMLGDIIGGAASIKKSPQVALRGKVGWWRKSTYTTVDSPYSKKDLTLATLPEMLVEPCCVVDTGDAGGAYTAPNDVWI